MTPTRARALLLVSAAVLVAVFVVWVVWPEVDGRADLEAVAALPSTTTVPATTTVPDPLPDATTTAVPTSVVPEQRALITPVRVRVPSIGLDARVVSVALAPDGQMEVPPATEVGWYRLGPTPGVPGSAVLAAHVDYAGQRGAFFDLRSVPEGAEVFVEGDGATRRFVVSTREQVAKDAVQLERYFTAEGPARLTLITCGGAFDRGARHYVDNIILTVELAPVPVPVPVSPSR